MKLAFISDIHANLPALKAVWEDIQKHKPDTVFCLGDLVNFAGWDKEVIEFIRDKNIPALQGNHDEGIGNSLATFAYSYKTEEQHQFGIKSIERLQALLSDDEKKFLLTLPFSMEIAYAFSQNKLKVGLVHGSVFSNKEYVLANRKDEEFLSMMDEMDVDILLMGHTHKPFHKSILCKKGNKKIYKHAINVGSVGKPKHGDNKACYVLLNIVENINLKNPESIAVKFMYVKL